MQQLVDILPHVNASLNALAVVLLLVGYILIKQKREAAHKWTMIACFVVSCVFLACYLTAHELRRELTGNPSKPFKYPDPTISTIYYTILISHVVLAATVPVLAIITIVAGFKDWRKFHRKIAWGTFPIWLYVSVTGVIVYAMLYHIYAG